MCLSKSKGKFLRFLQCRPLHVQIYTVLFVLFLLGFVVFSCKRWPSPHVFTHSERTRFHHYSEDLRCPAVDWATVPDIIPEVWKSSTKFFSVKGDITSFTLALPPPQSLYITEHMEITGGLWAPIQTLIFIHVLTSPKVKHAACLVVDVGANVGYFSHLALSLEFDVVAFEPQSRALPYLGASYRENKKTNRFQLYPCAVGSTRAFVLMENSTHWEVSKVSSTSVESSSPRHPSSTTVPMVLLSDFITSEVSVAILKINVEGFEKGVMSSLSPAVLRAVRNIVIEVTSDTESRIVIQKTFAKEGFFCRQFVERHSVLDASGNYVPGTQDTLMERVDLGGVLSGFLSPCQDGGSDNYWLSKDDWPWQCDTPGCS